MYKRVNELPFQDPIRDEIFSSERLEQFAIFLAREMKVSESRKPGKSLMPQVEKNHKILVNAYHELVRMAEMEKSLPPAAEWIIDNFHILEDQVREIRQDLPEGFYRELPKLVEGELKGYPRVYAIALAILAHTDSHLEVEPIRRFILNFQKVSPLQTGELWAVTIHLRIALVDNMRRVASQLLRAGALKEEAKIIVEQLLTAAEISDGEISKRMKEIRALLHRAGPHECALLSMISKRIRDQDPKFSPIMENIDDFCACKNQSIDDAIREDHHQQAVAQATTKNIVQSMRLLSMINWQDFFESVSLVDSRLALDPARVYKKMDFESRNRYRDAIERISKRTNIGEITIAEAVVRLSEDAAQGKLPDQRTKHVGYYLVDQGLERLENLFQYRPHFLERMRNFVTNHPYLSYFFPFITLLTLGLLPLIYYAYLHGLSLLGCLGLVAVALVPVSDTALNLMNLFLNSLLPPRILQKLDYRAGIPSEAKTIVVTPVIFPDPASARKAVENLEIHYVANQDPNLFFAILGDFSDAESEKAPFDKAIVDTLQGGIAELNARYCEKASGSRFFLFHRSRVWNPAEEKWMGWERKRGKLHEFNRFLQGKVDHSFICAPKFEKPFNEIQYAITLDADTQLPRDSARKLVATILHPLNVPQLDPETRRVRVGYGILQPRVSISLESSMRSRFSRIFSGHTGMDPYTTAVSDTYQDLFGSGSYTGKGLYVVDTFEKCVAERVPENFLLSHDLFEGEFARTALVSDIELLDDYPANYESFAKRQHRWTRGDWQIAGWIFGKKSNPLGLISRWKILDNLRRSVVAPLTFLWLLIAWTILPGSALAWTLAILSMFLIPPYVHATSALIFHPRAIPWTSNFWNVWGNFWNSAAQVLLVICFLSHQALLQTDAVLRTLYRTRISRKHLLEWITSAATDKSCRTRKLRGAFIWNSGIPALIALLFIVLFSPNNLIVAAPFLLLWLTFPAIAIWISAPSPFKRPSLTKEEEFRALLLARKTWYFFENFISESTNWLPPDNVQLDPHTLIAERTSPTNIGLLLMANSAAHELGFLSSLTCLERSEKTLHSMTRLERYRGHFLNWYDTKSLKPLEPRYVSTVDSGNLAGHLIVVKQTLADLPEAPLYSRANQTGLDAAYHLFQLALERLPLEAVETSPERRKEIFQLCTKIDDLLNRPNPPSLASLYQQLISIEDALKKIQDYALAWQEASNREALEETLVNQTALFRLVVDQKMQVETFAPWLKEPFLRGKTPELDAVFTRLDYVTSPESLMQVLEFEIKNLPSLLSEQKTTLAPPGSMENFIEELRGNMEQSLSSVTNFISRCKNAALLCDQFIRETDFTCLFDDRRKIFSIGLHASDGRTDDSYYDLLASEARLASFVAIGLGQIPQIHWFHLGRQLTIRKGKRVLISWSASMFEYLMPLLVMRHFPNTLLFETHHSSVDLQIKYGRHRGVPWGVSESGYNARDLQQNYQYGPFGVPGLGLKRGLRDDLVIAPYATALAALVNPTKALRNFRQMEALGWLGCFGFFEAVDYTRSRIPPGKSYALVKSYMAHHQGMTLCALANVIRDNVLQNRFHSDAMVGSAELLLQERMPKSVEILFPRREEIGSEERLPEKWEEATRRIFTPAPTFPKTQILSNGDYTVMINSSGSGFSRWKDLNVTRWVEDPTSDPCGFHFYLRDTETDTRWSAAFQPLAVTPNSFEAIFSEHKAEFRRKDGLIHSHLEILVSPEDDVELRQITLSNRSFTSKEIEITSYLEPVLLRQETDLAHMAFGKLFFQTELVEKRHGLLGHRRRRSNEEKEYWAFHVAIPRSECGAWEYETDRMKFVGRKRSLSDPLALGHPLSGTVGNVLDPIFSIRTRVRIAPESSSQVIFVTGLASSRDEALQLIDRYHESGSFERETDMAWTRSQIESRHLNVAAEEANLYQELASTLFYSSQVLRPPQEILRKNQLSQPQLWAHGLSGDLPIIAVRVTSNHDLPLVRQVFRAHEYLRMKNIKFDLVILNDQQSNYRIGLQEEILGFIKSHGSLSLLNQNSGIFLLRTDLISAAEKILIEYSARAVITPERGSLREQIQRLSRVRPSKKPHKFPHSQPGEWKDAALPTPSLSLFNGLGGFSLDGKEYVIRSDRDRPTPAPWANVVSNEKGFGFLITESGGGYTWSMNSRENKLTPWSNDPVIDPTGEVLYLRDEDTGDFWCPTPSPAPGGDQYLTFHGQGYTRFEHSNRGLLHQLTVFAANEDEVKIYSLRIKNQSGATRRLSVFFFLEWVLGVNRSKTAHYIRTDTGIPSGTLLARNHFDAEFGSRVAFASATGNYISHTCDRKEFLGPNGNLRSPAAMFAKQLDRHSGFGLDPCAAIQCSLELHEGEEKELIFLLGQAKNNDEVKELVLRYSDPERVKREFRSVCESWEQILSAVQIRTPEPDINFLFNRWLLYQTLSSRIRGRTAFYQAGGAYGFRDQLQDVLALLITQPSIARQHIIEAARHQFEEGDVLHWWHPPSGRGVRTHISDDLLWLPYAVCQYIKTTEDFTILEEPVEFLRGSEVPAEKEDLYFQPQPSGGSGSVYEHCKRALQRSLPIGIHKLPLIGGGDWNDGMNRVGHGGQGESIWLAWFLAAVLEDFSLLCERKGEASFVELYRTHAKNLSVALEVHGWDGDWYRRAFFDDGSPLGSKQNEECQIDSIAQSWAVLSGLARADRGQRAMQSVWEHLVLRDPKIVLLFTPPFLNSSRDPGYVKGYLPGVRENGGQYTHAAIWTMMALAKLGERKKANEVFSFLNPIRHSMTKDQLELYRVEPYVIAADVYAASPHIGRGGWTWYTGSAAWMYRAGLENILGVRLEGKKIKFSPCAPEAWPEYQVAIRFGRSLYTIVFENSQLVKKQTFKVELDGKSLPVAELDLTDDEKNHLVIVR